MIKSLKHPAFITLLILVALALTGFRPWIMHTIRRAGLLIEAVVGLEAPAHDFDVSGTVSDENGDEVPEAFLSINEYTPSAGGRTTRKQSYQRNVRSFHVKSSGYHALQLVVTKIGYEAGKVEFTSSTTQHGIHIIMKKSKVE